MLDEVCWTAKKQQLQIWLASGEPLWLRKIFKREWPHFWSVATPASPDVDVITTERLVLRPLAEEDFPSYAEMNADAHVMRFYPSPWDTPHSREIFDRMLENTANNLPAPMAVLLQETQEFVGHAGLSIPTWESDFTPCIEVGWRLVSKVWGQGFAPEAAIATIRAGKKLFNFPRHEVVSFTAAINSPSRRVMEKIGLSYDAAHDFDHPVVLDGPLRPHVLYRGSLDLW
jgi:ribosomal-protein-alanine N-acetyltransferase